MNIVLEAMHVSLFIVVLFIVTMKHVTAHGGMLEPPMRSIMWRYGFETPVNYDWMSVYCGGFYTFQQNRGKCGLCGDPFTGPFDHDRGGMYDNGIIVRHYPPGVGEIEVKVELTAHHKGYFTFKLCPNNERQLTQSCLNRYPLRIREARQAGGNPYRYYPPVLPKLNELHVELPADVTCDRCVLQWTYRAGNSNGQSPNGTNCIGCGIQETFVNCADVSIGGSRDNITVTKDNPQSAQAAGPDIEIPSKNNVMSIINNPNTTFQDMIQTLEPNVSDTQTQGQTQGRTPIQTHRQTPRRQENTIPTRREEHQNMIGSRRNTVPTRGNNLLDPSGINYDFLRQFARPHANNVVHRNRGQSHRGRLPTPLQQPSFDRNERLRQFDLSRDTFRFPSNRFPSNILNRREHAQRELPSPSSLDYSREHAQIELHSPSSLDYSRDHAQRELHSPSSFDYSRDHAQRELHSPSSLDYSREHTQSELPSPSSLDYSRDHAQSELDSPSSLDYSRDDHAQSELHSPSSLDYSREHAQRELPQPSSFDYSQEHAQSELHTPSSLDYTHVQALHNVGNSIGMSLIDTLNPLVNEIRTRNKLHSRHSNVGTRRFSPKTLALRGNRMASHRDAVRHSARLDRFQLSTNILETVPELPRNIGPWQDIPSPKTNRGSSDWFPDPNIMLHQQRMRQRKEMTAHLQFRLPRRIFAHSLGVAKHLLRKWPQLKGRVFLSKRAHLRNHYAHIMHKYSRRQRWY